MTMRGAARWMRSAITEMTLCRASSRSAAAGISAISRAMAVGAMRSALVMGNFADCHPQIAMVPPQNLGGIRRSKPKAEKDGNPDVAVCLLDEARRVGRRAADYLADDHLGAPPQRRNSVIRCTRDRGQRAAHGGGSGKLA